ncbi:MAG TPA: hypothetical protein VFU76_14550 [Terriglobales bacterium]|nr:hypothetical protein [Terriglobales bacterium]
MRWVMVVLCALLMGVPAAAQEKGSDSQILRDLLQEIRLLRRDLQTTTVAAQRVQIELYRLQLQDAAVARASRVADEAHERLADIRGARQRMAEQMQRFEEDSGQDPVRRREIEEAKRQLKSETDRLAKDEEQWQAKSSEAESQLRAEQNKLDALHSVLDELEQALANIGRGNQ